MTDLAGPFPVVTAIPISRASRPLAGFLDSQKSVLKFASAIHSNNTMALVLRICPTMRDFPSADHAAPRRRTSGGKSISFLHGSFRLTSITHTAPDVAPGSMTAARLRPSGDQAINPFSTFGL